MESMKPAGFTSEGTFTPDMLIAGDRPVVVEGRTLEASADLVRGTLVYLKNTEQAYSAYDGGTNTSGSLYGILVEDEDTTSGAKSVQVYIAGEFNANKITVASGTLEDLRSTLALQGIYLRNPVTA